MNSAFKNESDVLIIGAGLAGGIAALKMADLGYRVTLVKGPDSASRWSQGGIVYGSFGEPKKLIEDVLNAGVGHNFKPAVELLVDESERCVNQWLIERLKVPFDRLPNGQFDFAMEAAHSQKRILHVKDATGKSIMDRLDLAVASHPLIDVLNASVIDLLLTDRQDTRREKSFSVSRCVGASLFVPETKQVIQVVARATLLATGGFSQLYLHSTGPITSRGDGIAVAHRAGARTIDLEFVQFHPTSLYVQGRPRQLLTEALRGAGARILNDQGEAFVDALAPRDVVSRAIHEELLKSGHEHVWLDLREIADFSKKFPTIKALLEAEHIDPSHDLVPIVPAAHYTLGGVWTDLDGATSVHGLFAAGEVACTGLHGANRLASTSLLEALVFGERAAVSMARYMNLLSPLDFEPRSWLSEVSSVDPALLAQDWQLLKQTMWNYVGLVRSERRLRRAERILVELRTEVESFYKRSELSVDLISLRNAVLVSTLVLYAALRNQKSVGTHFLKNNY
jgi:L-aspartate oxidase